MILGIGTRRGITREEVLEAVKQALDECGLSLQEITAFASAKLKENERGLLEAGEFLGIPVNFLPDEVLNSYNPPSSSRASRFGLRGCRACCSGSLGKTRIDLQEESLWQSHNRNRKIRHRKTLCSRDRTGLS